jgi:hypothetical protein
MANLLSRIAVAVPTDVAVLQSMAITYLTNQGEMKQIRTGASWIYCSEVLGGSSKIVSSLT